SSSTPSPSALTRSYTSPKLETTSPSRPLPRGPDRHLDCAGIARRVVLAGRSRYRPHHYRLEMTRRKPMEGRRAPGSPPPLTAERTILAGSRYDPPRVVQSASTSRSCRPSSTPYGVDWCG